MSFPTPPRLWCRHRGFAQDLGPPSEDESVTFAGEHPQCAAWQHAGEDTGLRGWDAAVLFTLEDPHLWTDLFQGETPMQTLHSAFPAVRVDSLLDCFPDGRGEHAADFGISQKPPVRFWPWQIEETFGCFNQPRC